MKNFYDWIKEFVRDQGEFIAQQSGWLELERSSYAKLIAQTISHVLNGGSLLVSADSSRHWFLNYILSSLNPKDLKERPLLSVIDFNASSFYPKKRCESLSSHHRDDLSKPHVLACWEN